MNLDLDRILSAEEKLPELSTIDPEFFEKAARYIQELSEEKNRHDPESVAFVFAANQLETAKASLLDILQARMRKIVRTASAASAQPERKQKQEEPAAMTPEEREFYRSMLLLMSGYRSKRVEQMLGSAPAKKQITREPETKAEVKTPERTGEEKKDVAKDYTVVRLLRDVPTFVGMDNRNYTLTKEDVALIPAVNAQVLISKRAAVKIPVK